MNTYNFTVRFVHHVTQTLRYFLIYIISPYFWQQSPTAIFHQLNDPNMDSKVIKCWQDLRSNPLYLP